MSWLRPRIRRGAVLALVALALQLVLSFGHVHAGSFGQLTNPGQTTASAPTTPDQDPDGGSADACAICATIALADTLLLSAPPTLSPPLAFVVTRTRITSHAVVVQPTRTAFRSRAPPVLTAIV